MANVTAPADLSLSRSRVLFLKGKKTDITVEGMWSEQILVAHHALLLKERLRDERYGLNGLNADLLFKI